MNEDERIIGRKDNIRVHVSRESAGLVWGLKFIMKFSIRTRIFVFYAAFRIFFFLLIFRDNTLKTGLKLKV